MHASSRNTILAPIPLWQVHKSGRVLTCEAVFHPRGWAIRCHIDGGDFDYSEAFRSYLAARASADAKKAALLAEGWVLQPRHRDIFRP